MVCPFLPDSAPRSALGRRGWSPRSQHRGDKRGNRSPGRVMGRQAWDWWTLPGSTLLAGGWGAAPRVRPTCADGASRAVPTALLGGRVDVAGPSSERPEWEKSELRPQCSGKQARWSSTGSGGPAGRRPQHGEPGQRLTRWGGGPCYRCPPEGSAGAPWLSGVHT